MKEFFLFFSKKKGENLIVDKFILNHELLTQQNVASNHTFLYVFLCLSNIISVFQYVLSAKYYANYNIFLH